MKVKDLDLVLTGYWYDKIECGRKGYEFREATDYWVKRILKYNYTHVVLRRGYTNIKMRFEIVKIHRRKMKGRDFFAIELGKRVS